MVSITACKQASGAGTLTPKTLNDTALEQLVKALGTEFLPLRPFTLRAGCSLPYFREWDLQILAPGSSPPSIFFHSWLSTLFCLLLIVTVLCRLLPALPPRHFCSSLALLPIISAPHTSPFFTACAHQCGCSFHHPYRASQTRSTLSPSETKARKGHLGEAFYISYRQRAAGDSTGGSFFQLSCKES